MGYLTMASALVAHERVAGRFSSLLRSSPDGTGKVPHLTWTVGETAAHVLASTRLYPEMLAGAERGWADLSLGDTENARLLARIPERDPRELADAMDVAAAALREAYAAYPGDSAAWHAGVGVPPAAAVGLLVGDMIVHGWDIASAIDGTWVIEPSDACLSFAATMPVISHFVDTKAAKGFSATYGIQLRRGPTFTLAFTDGRLATSEGRPVHADCRMSADPVAYLLAAYRRIPLWRPVVRGKFLAYGRRPWLAAKLQSMLVSV